MAKTHCEQRGGTVYESLKTLTFLFKNLFIIVKHQFESLKDTISDSGHFLNCD